MIKNGMILHDNVTIYYYLSCINNLAPLQVPRGCPKLPKMATNPLKLAETVDFALFLHPYDQKWDDIA